MLLVHVELAPSLTVPPGLRRSVERAFREAGLSFEWRVMRGDRTGGDAVQLGVPIAQPTLHVVVSTLE
jgi:hypothetical protein